MKTYSWLNQNRFLSHLRTIFCALAILGVPLAFPSSAADRAERSVGRPEPASGGFFPCFTYAGPPRPVGENLIVRFNVTAEVTGTFTGNYDAAELDVVHRDGSITLSGSGVFTGSLNGGPEGTLIFTFNGIGNAVTGHETLHIVGTRGTGGLADINYEGTAEGDLGAPNPGCDVSGEGTYTGYVIFAR
jgi:hypothetical protein